MRERPTCTCTWSVICWIALTVCTCSGVLSLYNGFSVGITQDSSRLHYDPAELKVFENIECEWPVFLALLLIDSKIKGDQAYVSHAFSFPPPLPVVIWLSSWLQINHYQKMLERTTLVSRDGLERMPELYYVPVNKVHCTDSVFINALYMYMYVLCS